MSDLAANDDNVSAVLLASTEIDEEFVGGFFPIKFEILPFAPREQQRVATVDLFDPIGIDPYVVPIRDVRETVRGLAVLNCHPGLGSMLDFLETLPLPLNSLAP